MSAPIVIDSTRCTGCGLCVKGCGFGALKLVPCDQTNHQTTKSPNHQIKKIPVLDAGACRACSACVNACKFKAISETPREVVGTADLASYRDFWVFAEQTDGKIAEVVFELLSKGLELKAQRGEGCRLCAVLLCDSASLRDVHSQPQQLCDSASLRENHQPPTTNHQPPTTSLAESLTAAGADLVYIVDDPALAHYEAGVYTDALASLAEKHRPEVILAGATAIGRAFFARVAARLRTGLTADCTALEIAPPNHQTTKSPNHQIPLLHQSRPAFGGNIMATIMTPNHRPQMATVRPKVFKSLPNSQRPVLGDIVAESLPLPPPPTRLLEILRNPDSIDISAAEVLVAGGRGLKGAENFVKLYELARLLNGEVAASRAAVDAGWTTPRRQVGQTGRTVAPRLYLAFGISGAIQHLEGIRGSDRIIAVNTDPNAPIFGVADLGIVGDAIEVIDTLIKELQK